LPDVIGLILNLTDQIFVKHGNRLTTGAIPAAPTSLRSLRRSASHPQIIESEASEGCRVEARPAKTGQVSVTRSASSLPTA
jgi:hypothetical protein